MMSKPYTANEARQMYLGHIETLVKYWASLPDVDKATGHAMTVLGRCEGVAFSILSMIDGCSGLPALNLLLSPHPDDKAFLEGEGEDYFEPDMLINDCMLHDIFPQTT